MDLFILSNIFIGTSSSGGKIVNQKSVVTAETQKNILIRTKMINIGKKKEINRTQIVLNVWKTIPS